MPIKTCLLITDDPDDHLAFSEVLAEISSKTIVLVVLDSEKALGLVKSRKLIPDYIFLDISMPGIRINSFLNAIRGDDALCGTPYVVYGDKSEFKKIEDPADIVFFDKNYEYSGLRRFLKEFMRI